MNRNYDGNDDYESRLYYIKLLFFCFLIINILVVVVVFNNFKVNHTLIQVSL